MNHREILEFICDEARAIITREPYQITANGQRYEFATDGFQLLAFPVEQSDLPEIPAKVPKVKTVKKHITAWLTAPATHTTSAASFADFLNLAECVKCPCCKGSGRREPYMATYDEYGFAGDEFADRRYVKIGGYPFNANLIARTLALLDLNHLADEDLPVRIETGRPHLKDGGAALIFHGVKWTLIIMGLSIKQTANDDFDGEWEIETL